MSRFDNYISYFYNDQRAVGSDFVCAYLVWILLALWGRHILYYLICVSRFLLLSLWFSVDLKLEGCLCFSSASLGWTAASIVQMRWGKGRTNYLLAKLPVKRSNKSINTIGHNCRQTDFLGVVLCCWESRQLLMTLLLTVCLLIFGSTKPATNINLFLSNGLLLFETASIRLRFKDSKIGSNLDLLFSILLKILSVSDASRCHCCFTWSAVGSILKEGRCRSQFIDIYSSLLAHSSGELAGRWVISLRTDNSW